MESDGKPVRLVSNSLQELQRHVVVRNDHGLFGVGAEVYFFIPLGKRDDLYIFSSRLALSLFRISKLPFSAVYDEQVGNRRKTLVLVA